MKALKLVPLSCLCFLVLVSSLCSICFCNQNSDPVLCVPIERSALMDLKNNLTKPYIFLGRQRLLQLVWCDLHDDGDSLHSKSLKWLKNLKGLRQLDISYIDLAKALDWFSVISNLTSLLELHFSHCGLNRLPSNPTKVSLTSLIVLDLSNNYFDGMLLPGWIFRLHNLASLDLSYCGISGVNPETHGGFHSMPSLRTLRVSGNNFMNSLSLLNGLSSLSNLRVLDVSSCDIYSPILGNLHNLSLIEYLDLSLNFIVEEIPKSLSNLCNFTTLNLEYNSFSGNVSELLERFCECESPKLESLALGDNYLIGHLPERLEQLKNLVSFKISSFLYSTVSVNMNFTFFDEE
ncbi:hypothetical protein L1987_71142 [Smallanthus sonchifolius]|uniref:Uncharacterized protein n=1 Tax=Smallanthus sonchifolius TaxID=185202 RepID=A0ACB9AS89_9ASTR|nr:hypothetical protein L1987_71142 [Smallanthus sonchifolius]